MIEVIGGKLWQWDTGRKVRLTAPWGAEIYEVHFDNDTTDNALVGVVKFENGIVTSEIPNILLQSSNNLTIYSVSVDENGRRTEKRLTVAVKRRPKPDDYVYTETEVKNWDSLEKKINAAIDTLNEEIDTLNEEKESGKFDGADGQDGKDGQDGYTPVKGVDYWTEEDKTEIIEELSDEIPSGIDFSKINQAYVKDGVLVCNDNSASYTGATTAKYIGVDLGQEIQRAEIRFGFTGDLNSGDIASIMLITSKLGCSQTNHITKGACHFGISPKGVVFEFYDENAVLTTAFTQNFTQPLEPNKEYSFKWEIQTDNTDPTKKMLKITTPAGYLGTFKEGTRLWDNFVLRNGQYLILEHFYPTASKVRGYYTGVFAEANDDYDEYISNFGVRLSPNSTYFRHDFKHQSSDGVLTCAPTGQNYVLFSNEVNVGSALNISGVNE